MSTRFGCSVFILVFILSYGSLAALYKGDKCSLKDDSGGTCKFITECATAVKLLTTGVYPIICGFEKNNSIICCKDELTETTSTGPTTTQVTSRTPGQISKQKCKEYAEYAYETIQIPTLSLQPQISKLLKCDFYKANFIVGSTLATRREFPHMALIGYKPQDEVFWACGGSLISENFILTTGRCLYSREWGPPELVRVGVTNKTDLAHMQERIVSEIIRHPKYNPGSGYHDIGLLRLSRNLELNTYIRPACLQIERNIPFHKAISSGFGAIDLAGGLSDVLLKAIVEILSADQCNRTYFPSYKFKHGIVDDMMICAGPKKMSSCQENSGGPLQVHHNEADGAKCMYDIIGIISYGRSCGVENDSPGVFTRISNYIKWIEDIVWPN